MKTGYLSELNLRNLLKTCSKELLSCDWLIVALDSVRDDRLHKSYEFLKSRLPQSAKWTKSGIRLPGHDLVKADILVPFSAAFILEPEAPGPIAPYNETTESETFESGLPSKLEDDMKTFGVLAYVADGCGLSFCFKDASFAPPLPKSESS